MKNGMKPLDIGELYELEGIVRSLQKARKLMSEKGCDEAVREIGRSTLETDIFLFGDRIDELEKYLSVRLGRK